MERGVTSQSLDDVRRSAARRRQTMEQHGRRTLGAARRGALIGLAIASVLAGLVLIFADGMAQRLSRASTIELFALASLFVLPWLILWMRAVERTMAE